MSWIQISRSTRGIHITKWLIQIVLSEKQTITQIKKFKVFIFLPNVTSNDEKNTVDNPPAISGAVVINITEPNVGND